MRASLNTLSPRRRAVLAAAALAIGLAAALALAAVGGLLGGRSEGIEVPPGPPGTGSIADVAEFDPFAYEDSHADELIERGRDGYSYPLYAFSPGGAAASAARVARLRSAIETAAERHDVEPDTLEALVMLESAGRPEVEAGGDPEGAVGLGQILPATAAGLLGMSVDLEASKRITKKIERGERRARRADSRRARRKARTAVTRLERRRRAVDERYDPEDSLDGAGRYLALAERRFGREDLAVVSYHMGIGNLENVIEAYVSPARPERTTHATVKERDIDYARLFYDTSPVENPRTYALLAELGDDSRSYLLRIEAAREIMRLHRDDPPELARLERLHAAWPSGELVLRPPGDTDTYADAEALADGYEDGDLIPLPNDPERLGFSLDPALGALAARPPAGDDDAADTDPSLYRGLHPAAVAALLFITKEVQRSAGRGGLRVTDAARDAAYGRAPAFATASGEPPRPSSPHSSGYSFDIARNYPTPRVRRAFAYALERLRSLRVIDYVYEPDEIHITAGPDAERLIELQEALVPAPD